MTDPFRSTDTFRLAFGQGLADLLARHDGLGVYILVLANAAYEPALWGPLAPALRARHERHAAEITAALRAGRRSAEPEDDLMVFLKLLAMGFDAVRITETRQADPWQVQFNPVRALRPPRASGGRVEGLLRPFDPAGFHFNKPFLAKEVFWQGALAGKPARLLYNKFPFATLHGLLVPQPERGLPQWLTPELHGWAWEATQELAARIPGLGVAYNSFGAQASVNHLHFQTFTGATPVQSPRFVHNGGAEPYPLPCQVAGDAGEAWFLLDALHQRGTPYNLLYSLGRLHILPRAPQGSRADASWGAGMAWSELAGCVTVFSREDFTALTEADVRQALAGLIP
ncbi:MAG: hypothetical protein HZB71_07225 [Betaproteobacteria bacterium]|nr:hypothetical protein [Betaproteobacteria bacterium]